MLSDYERMLADATASSRRVAARVLAMEYGAVGGKARLGIDVAADFGDVLLGDGDGGNIYLYP